MFTDSIIDQTEFPGSYSIGLIPPKILFAPDIHEVLDGVNEAPNPEQEKYKVGTASLEDVRETLSGSSGEINIDRSHGYRGHLPENVETGVEFLDQETENFDIDEIYSITSDSEDNYFMTGASNEDYERIWMKMIPYKMPHHIIMEINLDEVGAEINADYTTMRDLINR